MIEVEVSDAARQTQVSMRHLRLAALKLSEGSDCRPTIDEALAMAPELVRRELWQAMYQEDSQ